MFWVCFRPKLGPGPPPTAPAWQMFNKTTKIKSILSPPDPAQTTDSPKNMFRFPDFRPKTTDSPRKSSLEARFPAQNHRLGPNPPPGPPGEARYRLDLSSMHHSVEFLGTATGHLLPARSASWSLRLGLPEPKVHDCVFALFVP